MHIPSHYVFLFVAILLGESAVLFVYTVIGLIKSNPLPYMVPPTFAAPEQLPVCAFYGPPEIAPAQTSTITTTVYKTMTPAAVKSNVLQSEIPANFQPTIASSFTATTIEAASTSTTATIENEISTASSTSHALKTVTLVVFSTSIIPASPLTMPPPSTVYITTMVPPSATV